jgi:hypothetical protein
VNAVSILQQAVLFAHLIAFAMTISKVLREDLRVLRTRRIDAPRLRQTQPAPTARAPVG